MIIPHIINKYYNEIKIFNDKSKLNYLDLLEKNV